MNAVFSRRSAQPGSDPMPAPEARAEREAAAIARSAELIDRVDDLLARPRGVYPEWKLPETQPAPAPEPAPQPRRAAPAPAPPGIMRAELNRRLDGMEKAVGRALGLGRTSAAIRAASSEARLDAAEARLSELEARIAEMDGAQ